MSKYQRIYIELLAPPFLAAILFIVGDKSDSWVAILIGFLPLLFFAYLFGIIPSALYTVVMEFWFRCGLHARFGSFCTVVASLLLGVAAGL